MTPTSVTDPKQRLATAYRYIVFAGTMIRRFQGLPPTPLEETLQKAAMDSLSDAVKGDWTRISELRKSELFLDMARNEIDALATELGGEPGWWMDGYLKHPK